MKNSMRNKLFILIFTLLLSFVFPTPVAASDGIFYGETIPAGTVVDHDVVLIGQNVVIDGKVIGNVIILGNQVKVNGTVDGSLILIGQNAGISGRVSGGVYSLALTLDLGQHSYLGRDLYVASVSLTSGNDSIIGRDLYAFGLDSGLSGRVRGSLHTVIGPIQLYNSLMRLLGFDELILKLYFSPSGQIEILTPSTGQHEVRLASLTPPINLARSFLVDNQRATSFDWNSWAVSLLRNWMALFLLGLAGLWLLRRPLDQTGEQLQRRPLQTTGIGLLVLVIAINLFVLALLLFVLFFALGLGLNYLGVWQISLSIWIISLACLAIALVLLWLFIVYGTKIIVAFTVCRFFERILTRKSFWLSALGMLVSTLAYTLLRAIPLIGWIFGIIVTAAGMGAAWFVFRSKRQKPAQIKTMPVIKTPPSPSIKKRLPKKVA